MDRFLLLAGLPVTVAMGAAALLLLSRGAGVWGLALLVVAIAATMFVAGQGLPRPVVVPRPGEEEHY